MGLISGLMGNAKEVTPEAVADELGPILGAKEEVFKAFKLVRDLIVFTERRLILIDKQGMTGKKIQYHSIPYKSITHFIVETAGHFDLEAVLTIFLMGSPEPIVFDLKRSSNVIEIQKVLAEMVGV